MNSNIVAAVDMSVQYRCPSPLVGGTSLLRERTESLQMNLNSCSNELFLLPLLRRLIDPITPQRPPTTFLRSNVQNPAPSKMTIPDPPNGPKSRFSDRFWTKSKNDPNRTQTYLKPEIDTFRTKTPSYSTSKSDVFVKDTKRARNFCPEEIVLRTAYHFCLHFFDQTTKV